MKKIVVVFTYHRDSNQWSADARCPDCNLPFEATRTAKPRAEAAVVEYVTTHRNREHAAK